MTVKSFGVKELNIIGTGTPTIQSPSGGDLNITAATTTFSGNIVASQVRQEHSGNPSFVHLGTGGRVGIGTSDPEAELHVDVSNASYTITGVTAHEYADSGSSDASSMSSPINNVSLMVEGSSIFKDSIYVVSDKRIKNNIEHLEFNTNLHKLRDIPPVSFKF